MLQKVNSGVSKLVGKKFWNLSITMQEETETETEDSTGPNVFFSYLGPIPLFVTSTLLYATN